MGENNFNEKSLVRIPDSVDNAVRNLTDKPTATIGETISDCFFLVFGGINQKAALKRARYSNELEEFKRELERKINDIPEERRLEANFHTICTALDNMKYCVEEKALKDMFSSLIANSLNSDKEQYVHPSYGEVIKQMTSLDALIFAEMNKQAANPIIKVIGKLKGGGSIVLSKNLISSTLGTIEAVAASLDNLSRLKLIDITFESYYSNEVIYDMLKRQPHIEMEIKRCESSKNENWSIEIKKGFISITEYGSNFFSACN